MSIYKLSKRN